MEEKILSNPELELVIKEFIDKEQPLKQHIADSMADLFPAIRRVTIEQFEVVKQPFPLVRSRDSNEKEVASINFRVVFSDVIGDISQITGSNGVKIPITPHDAIAQKLSYNRTVKIASVAYITYNYINGQSSTREIHIPATKNCELPIDIGGPYCVYKDMPKEQVLALGGDLDLFTGNFIIEGQIYAVHISELLKFSEPQIYHNNYKKEVARAQVICRNGVGFQNSFQIIIRYLKGGNYDNMITTEITAKPFMDYPMPFNLFFYMLGITRDDEIEKMILMSDEVNPTNDRLRNVIRASLREAANHKEFGPGVTSPSAISAAQWLTSYLSARVTDDYQKPAISDIQTTFDNMFMVHQEDSTLADNNNTDLAVKSRVKKAVEYAKIIRDMLLTAHQGRTGTDRDDPGDKRYHPSGVLFVRIWKKLFNALIVMPIRTKLTECLQNGNPPDQTIIEIISNTINNPEMTKKFEKAITIGNGKLKVTANMDTQNPIHSENIQPPKSVVYMQTAGRSIASSTIKSKKTERAYEMRAVHPAFVGYICLSASPDTGDGVGIPKQLAIGCSITSFNDPTLLRQILENDKTITPWRDIPIEQTNKFYLVYLNGNRIGGTSNANMLTDRYRKIRRQGQINRKVTIVYNPFKDRIDFWTDFGRIYQIYFIVENNLEEILNYDLNPTGNRPTFFQRLKYTPEIHEKFINKQITVKELITNGYLEYITAEEVKNCLVAPTPEEIYANRFNELKPFTHAITPLQIFGISAIGATLPTLSGANRQSFLTQMIKQANVGLSYNSSFINGQNMHEQVLTEYPLTPTQANLFIPTGGTHQTQSYASMGDNQEDSFVVKGGAIERGYGLSTTAKRIEAECKAQVEHFGMPSQNCVQNKNGNFGKLNAEKIHVPVGTILSEGDVVIAKYQEVTSKDRQSVEKSYRDESIIFSTNTHGEKGYVYKVVNNSNSSRRRITVHYRHIRPLGVGAKAASRSGNKGVISRILPDSHMPFSIVTGNSPDICVNPHSFPSRMLPGEVATETLAKVAAIYGQSIAVSPFIDINLEKIFERLKAKNLPGSGVELMMNPLTGDLCRGLFISPGAYRQILQKYPVAEISARTSGKISPTTRNALSGSKNSGGQRTGEMEFWVIGASGASNILQEFQRYNHSNFNHYICQNCGGNALYNNTHPEKNKRVYYCKRCKGNTRIVCFTGDYIANSLRAFFSCININCHLQREPYQLIA